MSTFKVTAEKLTIHEHPNADALELAQVGLYRAVVVKGQYQTGDWAVYVPEQAILPQELIDELGLANYLAGRDHNRVVPVKLRGQLSQGIVCLPAALVDVDLADAAVQGVDFAEQLGITKWVPEVPLNMAGEVEQAANMLRWIDIPDVKRYPDVFAPGEHVIATEKIHGSCCCLTVFSYGFAQVTSKGLGEQHLALVHSDTNLYWRAVTEHNLIPIALTILDNLGVNKLALFGEVFGAGVQDLHYGVDRRDGRPGYRAFDIRVEDEYGNTRWLSQDELVKHLALAGPAVHTAPRVYDGPYDVDLLFRLAEQQERISGTESHLGEGLVVRPVVERTSEVLGGTRAIVKIKSERYLTRKNGTEYT
jgi:RNA ligase (TIGR02306 family)